MTGRRLDFGPAVDPTAAVDLHPQKAYTQEPLPQYDTTKISTCTHQTIPPDPP